MKFIWFFIILIQASAFAASTTIDTTRSVLTYHNDNARTGQTLTEQTLTRSLLRSGGFGKIGSLPVDGEVYAQPLYVKNIVMKDGRAHNVLIVATEHDSVYAFDADPPFSSQPLWKRSFIGDDVVPCVRCRTLSMDEVNAPNISPEIGITATPVIDSTTGTLYVTAATFEGPNTTGLYYVRLHALNLRDGSEINSLGIRGAYVGDGTGSVNGSIAFNSFRQLSRAGLALSQGHIYVAFSSYNDQEPAHGWIFSYSASTLAFESVFMTSPHSGDGNIWMSGGAPAIDAQGNVYFASGNGDYQALISNRNSSQDFHDSFMKLSPSLALLDYFKPYNYLALAQGDVDLGSGGLMLLPDQLHAAHKHVLLGGGKQGTLYLVDRNALGGFNPSADQQVVQELPTNAGGLPGGTNYGPGIYGTPSYFNGHVYIVGAGDALRSYPVVNGLLDWGSMQKSNEPDKLRGATTSISANKTKDGIVWYMDASAYTYSFSVRGYAVLTNGPTVLTAYSTDDLSAPLFRSDVSAENAAGLATKFAVPTVADGKVFVGTSGEPLSDSKGLISYSAASGYSKPGLSNGGYSPGGISIYGKLVSDPSKPFVGVNRYGSLVPPLEY